jgi:hypothetical protein
MRNGTIVSARMRSLAIGISISILALWGVARAETPDLGIDLSTAQPIFDNQLDTMRGKFVPGNIEAFNLYLTSSIDGNGVTRTAGTDIGVNFKTGKLTIDEPFSSESTSPGGSNVVGGTASGGSAPLNNLTGGVAQVVQEVGSGNSGANVATINIISTPPQAPIIPSGGQPCTTCSVTITKKGISVTVGAPGIGEDTQMIGASQITQGIVLNANDAAALNSLALQVQMTPAPNSNLSGLGSIINSVPVFLH